MLIHSLEACKEEGPRAEVGEESEKDLKERRREAEEGGDSKRV